MLNWKKFVEQKEGKEDLEDKEEELGVDLDDDDEEGESEAHKKKVFGKKEDDDDDECSKKKVFGKIFSKKG